LEIIANTLRLFDEGTKVAIEITIMATDAELINAGEICYSYCWNRKRDRLL